VSSVEIPDGGFIESLRQLQLRLAKRKKGKKKRKEKV